MYDTIAGNGLGGSSIALFGRVGGGTYTQAADVGADPSGKKRPEGKQVGAMQVVLELISFVRASKQAGKAIQHPRCYHTS